MTRTREKFKRKSENENEKGWMMRTQEWPALCRVPSALKHFLSRKLSHTKLMSSDSFNVSEWLFHSNGGFPQNLIRFFWAARHSFFDSRGSSRRWGIIFPLSGFAQSICDTKYLSRCWFCWWLLQSTCVSTRLTRNKINWVEKKKKIDGKKLHAKQH